MINVLSDNKVLLTFYDNLSKNPSQNTLSELKRLLRNAIDNERRLMMDVNSEIKKLDPLFKTNGFKYLLPKFTFFRREQSDIDVLVPPEDFDSVLKLLQSRGYKVTSVQSPWKVTLAKWIENRRTAVHVHSRLHWYPWDPLEFVPSGNLWQRAQTISLDDSVKVLIPCAEDSILILAAHAMFEDRGISLSDVFQLDGIVLRFREINWREIADIAYENGWCSDLLAFLENVNYLSYSLYGKTLVPEEFFSHIEKKIPLGEKLLRKLAGKMNGLSIPWRYPFRQAVLSFVNVALKKYGSGAILRIPDGLVYRSVYQFKSSRGDPCAQI